ncbi:hypothetical protein [Streptomyces griseofuscus]|uniref:hypothetical protein n=1 Tax=Streptomyces griseofuscus TaxID=146922 RepID=UPI00381ED82D
MTPVGAWTARVRRPGGESTAAFRFTACGHALLVAGGLGAGHWSWLGPGSFLFRITEPVLDDAACVGWVDIEQRASLNGGSFTGRGTSRVHDADGRLARAVAVEIHATRVAP